MWRTSSLAQRPFREAHLSHPDHNPATKADRGLSDGVGTPPQPQRTTTTHPDTKIHRPAPSSGFETLADARSSTTQSRPVVSTDHSLRSLLDHLGGSLLNHRRAL